MQEFKYIRNDNIYYFSFLLDGHIVGKISIIDPIINKNDLDRFLNILNGNKYGIVEIKTETHCLITLINAYNTCCFDYRMPGTEIVMQMVINYDKCIDALKEFINDLLNMDNNIYSI